MFGTKKTLIVVYKDELLMNQLKKMVETHDDSEEGIVGTKDDSVNIVSWTEKVWLGNKKAGNLQGKVLFLGDIKGTDKLIPVIDVKFDVYGVKYGWAGNQAIVFADLKALANRNDYDAFLAKLSELPVPDILKATKETESSAETDQESDTEPETPSADSIESTAEIAPEAEEKKKKQPNIFEEAWKMISTGAETIGKAGSQVAVWSEEFFRDKSLMKQQMLCYGVVNLYFNGLETFMDS